MLTTKGKGFVIPGVKEPEVGLAQEKRVRRKSYTKPAAPVLEESPYEVGEVKKIEPVVTTEFIPKPKTGKVGRPRLPDGPRKREYPDTDQRRAYMRDYMRMYRQRDKQ